MKILKVLNPFIWFINVFILYFGWLDFASRHPEEDLHYDFSQDLKYF